MAQVLESMPPTGETQAELLAPGSGLGLVLVIAGAWGVSQQMEGHPLSSACPSVTLPLNKYFKKYKLKCDFEGSLCV